MPGTPPIILGLTATSTPVLQAGATFSNRNYGLDDGRESYFVHPLLPKSAWPQVGNTSLANPKANPQMFATEVTPRLDESTLLLLEVSYKGIAGTKPDKITPDCDVQMITMPGGTDTGGVVYNTIIPVPQPKVSREYISLTQPTYAGVSGGLVPATNPWLPDAPSFTLEFTPQSGTTVTNNYWENSWFLQARTWQEIVPGKVWFVRETAVYTYKIAS